MVILSLTVSLALAGCATGQQLATPPRPARR